MKKILDHDDKKEVYDVSCSSVRLLISLLSNFSSGAYSRMMSCIKHACMNDPLPHDSPPDSATLAARDSRRKGYDPTDASSAAGGQQLPTTAKLVWEHQTSNWLKTHGQSGLVKSTLTKAEVDELKELFSMLDADGRVCFSNVLSLVLLF